MKSTGFGIIAWLSAALTALTILFLLTETVVGLILMFALGVFHVVIALVMLFVNKQLAQTLRTLFFAYCAGVVTFFAVGLVVFLLEGDLGDEEGFISIAFAMLLGISFSTLKFVIYNSKQEEKHVIADESILDA